MLVKWWCLLNQLNNLEGWDSESSLHSGSSEINPFTFFLYLRPGSPPTRRNPHFLSFSDGCSLSCPLAPLSLGLEEIFQVLTSTSMPFFLLFSHIHPAMNLMPLSDDSTHDSSLLNVTYWAWSEGHLLHPHSVERHMAPLPTIAALILGGFHVHLGDPSNALASPLHGLSSSSFTDHPTSAAHSHVHAHDFVVADKNNPTQPQCS